MPPAIVRRIGASLPKPLCSALSLIRTARYDRQVSRSSSRPRFSDAWSSARNWWAGYGAPRLAQLLVDNDVIRPYRGLVCSGLHGEVVELGFGAGLNLPFYPPEVVTIIAVEPSDLAWRRAMPRIARQSVPVIRGDLDGRRLDLPDSSADCVLSTFTMCTVPDPTEMLDEVVRVLRPGGQFHFLEHGLAPEQGVRRWQHWLDPVHSVLLGGCHLTRPIDDIVTASDLVLDELVPKYPAVPAILRPWTYGYRGRAHKPAN